MRSLVRTDGGMLPCLTSLPSGNLFRAGSREIAVNGLPFDPSLLKKRGLPWTREARVGPQPPAKVVQ
jgi:hypothetical protein